MPLIGTANLDRNRAAVSVPAAQTPKGQTETLIPAVTLVDEAGAAFTAGTVIDDDGNAFNPDSLPQALTYNGDDTVATITATDGADSWVQTYTWTSGNLTGVSQWVKQ